MQARRWTSPLGWAPLLLAVACGEKDGATDDSGAGADSSPAADADADGHPATADCDDANPEVHPGAVEVCDGRDNNCDGLVDDEDPAVAEQPEWYSDGDGDGFGAASAAAQRACEAPTATAAQRGDCDDSNADIHPDSTELCDGLDNDCDALVDSADPTLADGTWYYPDLDADGYGAIDSGELLCEQPAGYTTDGSDCDDTDRQIKPGGRERCADGVDNNCDGAVDDADTACGGGEPTTWAGEERYRLGFDPRPDVLVCDLVWAVSGAKSTNACPECDYSFDLTHTYDSTRSVYTYEFCAALAVDRTGSYGIDTDFYGYGYAVLWEYGDFYDAQAGGDATIWAPVMYADWDADRERVEYTSLYYLENYPYTYKGQLYYYTYGLGGYGQLR